MKTDYFSAGALTFAGLSVATEGTYLYRADCSAPYGQVQSDSFDTFHLEIRFTSQPPGSIREEATFDVSIAFYNNDDLATTATGPLPSDVSCALKLSDGSVETTIETDTISDTSKCIHWLNCHSERNVFLFAAGALTFDGVSISEGGGYILIVDCGAPYSPIQSNAIVVSNLEVRFTTQPSVSMVEEETFSVSLAFWDPTTNALATTTDGPLPSAISCELKLCDGNTETTLATDTISDTSK